MSLEHCAVSRGVVLPNADSGVSGARGDQRVGWVDGDVVDWTFVSLELVGSAVGLEVSSENDAVHR